MVSLVPKTSKPRRLSPAVTLVLSCLASLGAGIFFGKYVAQHHGAVVGSLTTPAGTAATPGPICLNTCPKARNGVCDDGRVNETQDANAARHVFCDLGTDCDDCGAWQPSGPVHWLSGSQGPISLLVSKGVEVRVKNSSTSPPFAFAYTDPALDFDVSAFFDGARMVERSITKIFTHIFRDGCVAPGPAPARRSLFVDVGANFGWFSLLAASMGCRVVAFEPVPHFFAFFEFSAHLNGLSPLLDMRRSLVSNVSGVELRMGVPSLGIWGTAGIGGLNLDSSIKGSSHTWINVPSVTLDQAVKEDVLLLKVDVEGWEWSVMQGASSLLTKRRVDHVIMEYSPGVPERHFRFADIIATVRMLMDLVGRGYRIGHIGEHNKHGGNEMESPLEPMEEVLLGNLEYDLRDAEAYAVRRLGCPIPTELWKYKAWAAQCGLALPEDVSPHSLRSMIGHNTNVWAARSPGMQVLQGSVGIIKLGADAKQYFVDAGQEVGMGSRYCAHIEPAVQVRHRCPCTDKAVCGEEAALVQQLVDEGQIATNYRLEGSKVAAGGKGGRRGGSRRERRQA